jgi:hypothetical protein
VTGHVDHVIDAAGDPVVAVGVAAAAVAGEIFAPIGGEVGLLEAGVYVMESPKLAK